jgi:hypothetical protein
MTIKAMAESLEKTAYDWIKKGVQYFPEDKEMQEVYASDARDILAIIPFIKEANFSKAHNKMWLLDTVVRDIIPDDVYEACEKLA